MERDSFGGMSDKEMKELRRATPWLKPGYMDAKAMNDIVGKISEKKGRSIKLSSYTGDEAELDSLAKTLDTLVLYEEVRTRCLNSKPNDRSHLIHQAPQKNALDQTRLFEWHNFIEIILPFISTIEYRVKNKKRDDVSHHSTSLVLSNKDIRVVVQDKLVESHFDDSLFTAPELIEPIERTLNASLIKVVIFREISLFFFEWEDPMPFVFVIAFRIILTDRADKQLVQETVVTLHRKDVMDFTDEEDEKKREEELAKQKARKERRAKKKAMTTPHKQNLLKALIKGMDDKKSDDDDDEEEEDGEEEAYGGMEVEGGSGSSASITPSTIKHVNSMTLEKEYLLKSFISNIRGSNVSYMTVAYVKRY